MLSKRRSKDPIFDFPQVIARAQNRLALMCKVQQYGTVIANTKRYGSSDYVRSAGRSARITSCLLAMRNDQTPLKLAIVGCGMITDSAHLPAALASRAVQVVALVDAAVTRADLLASKYGIRPRTSSTIDEVLGDADAFLMATPNHLHFPLAKQALSKRKAVLVEKPLTNTYSEAVELCELAERNDTVLATGFVSRYAESIVVLEELLDAGVLGKVIRFNYQFGTAGGWAPVSGYSLQRQQSGGGVLVVSGTHFLDHMLHLFGWPNQFAYEDDSRGGLEANCRATVFFSNSLGEFTGTIALSKTTPLANRLKLTTEEYECTVPNDTDMPLTLCRHDLPHIVEKLTYGRNWGDPFRLQLEDFAKAVQNGGRTRADGRAGALCVRLVEEFYAARVAMPEPWSTAAGAPK